MTREIKQNITKSIKDKMLEIADILYESYKNANTIHDKLFKEHGLDNLDDEYSLVIENKALNEWKDILLKMSVLLREISSSQHNELSTTAKGYALKNKELYMKLESVKDTCSEEYKQILKERNVLKDPTMIAYYKEEAYMYGCLNELLELFRKWWWDILFLYAKKQENN